MIVSFGLTAPHHALGFTLPRDRTHHALQTARTRRHRTKQRRQPLQRLSYTCFSVVETVFSHTTIRTATRVPDFHVLQEMRICLFCDQPAGNAEHIIAEWLSTSMDRRHQGISAVTRSQNNIIKERPPTRFKSLTLKKVCQGCNNGWMSDLESDFKKRFEHLVVPRSFDDGLAVNTLMQDHRETLIRWLLKSAVVAEHSLRSGDTLMIPPEISDARNIDIDSQGFHLFAGEIIEQDFTLRLRKGYRTFNGGIYHEDRSHSLGFNFSIQLNHLALALVNCPGAFPGAKSPYSIDGAAVMPLIPSSQVNWNMDVRHLFAEFEQFVESIEIYATEPN